MNRNITKLAKSLGISKKDLHQYIKLYDSRRRDEEKGKINKDRLEQEFDLLIKALRDNNDELIVNSVAKILWLTNQLLQKQPSQSDGAKMVKENPLGGIDLNPNQLDLKTSGDQIQFNLPAELKGIDLNSIKGFTPIIYQITPVTNLPLLLGEGKYQPEEQLSSLR